MNRGDTERQTGPPNFGEARRFHPSSQFFFDGKIRDRPRQVLIRRAMSADQPANER
jgi:hypothetical protein